LTFSWTAANSPVDPSARLLVSALFKLSCMGAISLAAGAARPLPIPSLSHGFAAGGCDFVPRAFRFRDASRPQPRAISATAIV